MITKDKNIENRILEISKKHNLSHLGSCLTAYPIIDYIYSIKKPDEKFVLSSGHAGLGLYCVIEKYEGKNAEEIYNHHGVHPDRCEKCNLHCSTGSLGLGLTIALGMALSDRNKNVYCLISDGESAEGTIWEVANVIKKYNVTNLKVYLNFNGFGAYDPIPEDFKTRIRYIFPFLEIVSTDFNDYPFLEGLSAHYITLKDA